MSERTRTGGLVRCAFAETPLGTKGVNSPTGRFAGVPPNSLRADAIRGVSAYAQGDKLAATALGFSEYACPVCVARLRAGLDARQESLL